jgi:SAM-dependent methyltransferase
MYGANPWEWYAKHPAEAAEFNAAMTALSGTLHKAAVEAYDFSGIKTIMDVGGGHGHLLAQILAKYPSMRGILFDQPHVVSGSAPVFARLGVTERARAEGGSFFERVPEGADAHIMGHIIHDWDDEHATKILRVCRRSIAPGGRLLVVDAVIGARNEPDFSKLLDLEMLLVPGGRERTAEEFATLFTAGGWKLTRIIPTGAGKSIIEGTPV